MSTPVVRYFHSAALRQRYIDALDAALKEQRIDPAEHTWLSGPVLPLAGTATDPVRVDRLTLDDGSPQPFELAAALLLSHSQTDDTQVYLYTLGKGVERFADRAGLAVALTTRFAYGGVKSSFEYTRLQGDPFRAQMLAIVDHQAARSRELSEQLLQMPSLRSASTASLSLRLSEMLPHMTLDPEIHLLQRVVDPSTDVDSIAIPQTLAQAAFDEYCAVERQPGEKRRFFTPQGTVASRRDSALLAQALAQAAAQTGEHLQNSLGDYWAGIWQGQRTRRELAIESLRESVRRELYQALDDGTLSLAASEAVRALLQSGEGATPVPGAPMCSRLSVQLGEGTACSLAGTFVIEPRRGADRSLLWFSPEHRFVTFSDRAALTSYLKRSEGRAQVRTAVAFEDQPAIEKDGTFSLEFAAIANPLFAERVDSVLALQKRNLRYALGLSNPAVEMSAMVDDALDVRRLLDPKQLQVKTARWRLDAPLDFGSVWLGTQFGAQASRGGEVSSVMAADDVTGSETTANDDTDSAADVTAAWQEQVGHVEAAAERLRQLPGTLREYAESLVQPYLSVLSRDALPADGVRLQWMESGDADAGEAEHSAVPVSEGQRSVTIDLISYVLECVTGHRARVLPDGTQVLFGEGAAAGSLTADLIDHLLSQVVPAFTPGYLNRVKQSRNDALRQGDVVLRAAEIAKTLRAQAMRLDLALARRQKRLGETPLAIIKHVLERPVRSMRLAEASPIAEAYSLSLTYGRNKAALLGDTLVLRQSSHPNGPVVLWSCNAGWRGFSSLTRLSDVIQDMLEARHRDLWLQLLGERDRTLLEKHLATASNHRVELSLARIDGHVIDAVQQTLAERQQQDLQQLCARAVRCRFEAGLFTQLARAAGIDSGLSDTLDGLSLRVSASLFEAMLPPWLTSASLDDLKLYNDLFKRYYLASDGGRDFLFEIPTLNAYARERVIEQLTQDFPGYALSPDEITVVSRKYVSAIPAAGQLPAAMAAASLEHHESLTEYAINRFVHDKSAVLSVELTEQEALADVITPAYVKRLVRNLDVGAGYRALLRKTLSPGDANFVTRNRLFVEQLPPVWLALALPKKLRGELSEKAFNFISSVLEMPDGIAREPVGGVGVTLSPLQLVADKGMTPDTVKGLYVIGPQAEDSGPVVLCTIHHSPFVFREYASRDALMADIRSDAALQALILERIDPEVHRRYANNGFTEPHLPFATGGFGDFPTRAPGPVTLGVAPVQGNALQLLFEDTVHMLVDSGVANTVTNQEDDQAGRRFLAIQGANQVLTLLPGKIAAMVTLWQSQTLLRASAASAAGRHWGEALSEFTAGLSMMVSTREHKLDDRPVEEQLEAESPASGDDERQVASPFSWGGMYLTAEQRLHLQGFEAKNVALKDMRHDKLLNLYQDTRDDTRYVVVAGRVYRVLLISDEAQWMIIGAEGEPGPRLVMDSQQHWQLDLSGRLRGGGGIQGRLVQAEVDRSAADSMTVEARGMPEIRLLYRDRARRIGQAHLKAKRYLEVALDNLNGQGPGAALDPRVSAILSDYFGVATPDTALVQEVTHAVKVLFDALMDPSLSPFSSKRFIVGSNRPGHDSVTAFVIKGDAKQRIFLTEKFFNVPQIDVTPQAALEGFSVSLHHRAANLIHELTHLTLDTHDIAYLESMAPYPDLILQNTAENVRLYAYVKRLHRGKLSHRSRRNDLFTVFENGQRRDLDLNDGRGYDKVLRLCGKSELDDARDVFLTDHEVRRKVMLNNADSLTLLILLLGRHRIVLPSP